MSFNQNYKMWITTKNNLQELIKRQDLLKKLPPIDDPLMTYKIFSELYILYVELVNKLTYCYLHTLQVQKRDIVRTLVDSAVNRLMELKTELQNLELSEYIYVDKALIQRKLQPSDLMIWKSPNFLYRRPPVIQNIFYENKIFQDEEQKKELDDRAHNRVTSAVKLIQAHERARRARVYKSTIKFDKGKMKVQHRRIDYQFTHPPNQAMMIPVKRTIYNLNYIKPLPMCKDLVETAEVRIAAEMETPESRTSRNKAARIIQRVWHAFKRKRANHHKRVEQEVLLGMKLKRHPVNPLYHEQDIMDMYKYEMEKARLDEEFLQLIEDERTRILQERKPWIMEDISDHIRAWFRKYYDEAGGFHPYPEAVKQGTVLVLRDETMDIAEFKKKKNQMNMTKAEKQKIKEKERAQKKKEKEKLKKIKQKEAKKRKDMKAAGIYDLAYDFENNKYMQSLEQTIKKYSVDWRFIDEYLNKNHDPIKDWVTQDELAKIHIELRQLVDEYMVLEYELLQKALAKDEGRKYKKQKHKKGKKRDKGRKKKKEPVDITADRSIDSLYEELRCGGFLQERGLQESFNDFIAEFNFLADDTRDQDHLTTLDPSIGDIKMVVEQCMFGMGEFSVPKPKAMLFIGPFASGKRKLCKIIACELDALVINLSPERTCHYSEEELDYLMHVVMKVAKAFQPTLLYIEEVHRVFWKKIPPEFEELKPRLLENYLQKKIIKPIKKDDRVMLMATSQLPWTAKSKMKRIFQKVIMIPRTDYGTAFLMWLNLLEEFVPHNVEDYHISALAKVMQKYTTGDVVKNVAETMTLKRRLQLGNRKLIPSEFLETFIAPDEPKFPLDDKIMNKYRKWYNKSSKLAKMRAKFFRMKKDKDKKKKR